MGSRTEILEEGGCKTSLSFYGKTEKLWGLTYGRFGSTNTDTGSGSFSSGFRWLSCGYYSA
jgi:hypothetical protein